MTARIPLFEFMPYGAPELHEASHRHMFRALAAASLVWVFVFAAGVMTGALPAPATRFVTPTVEVLLAPPPPMLPPPPARTQPIAPATLSRAHGAIIPVIDEPPPPPLAPDWPGGIRDAQGLLGGEAGDAPPVTDRGVVAEPPLPNLGDKVRTDELPVLVTLNQPEYPDIAREAGVEGLVVVHVLVGRDGRVIDARLDAKFSVPMLDATALASARKLVFQPAIVDHHPVAVWVEMPYRFHLH